MPIPPISEFRQKCKLRFKVDGGEEQTAKLLFLPEGDNIRPVGDVVCLNDVNYESKRIEVTAILPWKE